MIILHGCSNLLHMPFPCWVDPLNLGPWRGQQFRTCILAAGLASWARGGHTPKRKQLLVKVEPILVTFWDFGIETLRQTE